ncbi:MAG: AlpA family transcriptional regulator [Azonexus sp.]|nr:AlpA family transcriptional regulator [Azonexus sp.]MDP3636913.1 AlpA family transcriptional regulator [Azonexus sp.]MDZ4316881.1 AlpA family transcriptional regulator [Azonexus sp.]
MPTNISELIQNVKKRLLSLPEVEIVTGLSKPTIYRHIQKSTFPAPLKISTRRVGWLAEDIDGWLASLQRTN